MVGLLSALVGVLAITVGILAFLYIRAAASLRHYSNIADSEQYRDECSKRARDAELETARLQLNSEALHAEIVQHQSKVAQYQQLLGRFRTAAELKERIQSDTARAQRLAATLQGLQRASELDQYLKRQQANIQARQAELEEIASAINAAKSAKEIAAQVAYYENLLAQLKADIEAVEETGELQEFGFYRPRFDFNTAEEYKRRLEANRAKQKAMLKAKSACECHTEWTVDGNRREGEKMVNQQIKLMLRAFNGECDAAVERVRYNNAVALEKRIKRSFEAINKLGETKRIYLTASYCHLKYDELHLAHEYQEKKQEEREEARRIRDQMREEEKVAREIEKAKEDAERDEASRLRALERARRELAEQAGHHTAKLEALVSRLENELQEALDRKAKAIARAQLTRSGHVYILSNIGTFGESVYKIGMTRRLEPLERVKELGGAAVPFPFDVHAMIYCEDAPRLENELHRHFSHRRVNMVNLRREFFRVTLDEVRAAVADHFGHVTFVTIPQAEQFRKTLALQKESAREPAPLQIA